MDILQIKGTIDLRNIDYSKPKNYKEAKALFFRQRDEAILNFISNH